MKTDLTKLSDRLDTDILKPDTGYLTVIERPTHSKGTPTASTSGSLREVSPEGEIYGTCIRG